MTDAVHDQVLLANLPFKAESRWNNLEQVTGGIGLYVNAEETEFVSFKRKNDHLHFQQQVFEISRPLHTLGSMKLMKLMLMINEQDFFQVVTVLVQLHGNTTWAVTKRMERKKKLNGNYTRTQHAVLDKSWKQQPTLQLLYSH